MNWSTWFFALRVTLFSLASAPGANAHTADAQLPAYWRIEGRNDTLSGRKVPRIGKNNRPGRVSHGHGENSSTSGAMISTVVPATWAITSATRDGRRSLGKSR